MNTATTSSRTTSAASLARKIALALIVGAVTGTAIAAPSSQKTSVVSPEAIAATAHASPVTPVLNCGPNGERYCTPQRCYCI